MDDVRTHRGAELEHGPIVCRRLYGTVVGSRAGVIVLIRDGRHPRDIVLACVHASTGRVTDVGCNRLFLRCAFTVNAYLPAFRVVSSRRNARLLPRNYTHRMCDMQLHLNCMKCNSSELQMREEALC